ncbi:sigma-70 family RNA polymerase sigma factor [Actinoplanes sp. TBRC 11911]|uniref:sigma-70 family RNA polymerase sigma factor n=1 Tax=Actinoplanes sp. TBRC 11911 TaxID=2729386 RepID=UPI00145C7AEB|nr:sigma-70 family RNA polymerase sigma factor [Actinoplanes sp. TBRC 11911]NMO56876.1 sigma-70 family RNA polymerase sigma factor [Actinoplanes sp. TBRC 11911]
MTEIDMVRSAQGGDASALGLLLRTHEAGMRAVALAILGYGPDAEDAVQDAMMVALRRIGDLRDPDSAGAWLRTIVRNICRAFLRSRTPVTSPDVDQVPGPFPSPEEAVDDSALRDWVWHAIGELSEADRLVMLLRHFSHVNSYEQIAALCDLPVGTVRSRLSHARGKLASALQDTVDAAHADAGAYAASRRREASDAIDDAMRGHFDDVVYSMWLPDATVIAGGGVRLDGREAIIAGMAQDLDDGVRQRLLHVVASPDVLIWETEMLNPPDKPFHCPPNAVWLHKMQSGRVRKMKLFHPKPALALQEA